MKILLLFLTLAAALTGCVGVNSQQLPKETKQTKETKQMRKALVVITSHSQLGNTGRSTGYYLSEAAPPYFALTEAGFDVAFVSPQGGKAPMDEKSKDLSDPQNRNFLENPAHMAKIENTLRPDQVRAEEYDAIFFAGGHGTMWDFPDNKRLAEITARIYERGGVVGAVCHGPAALVNVKLSNGKFLVDGKTVSTFTNEEEEAVEATKIVPFLLETRLIERGAKVTKAANFQPHVIVSERLVTGQNPASAAGVGKAMVELIEKQPISTKAEAATIKR